MYVVVSFFGYAMFCYEMNCSNILEKEKLVPETSYNWGEITPTSRVK